MLRGTVEYEVFGVDSEQPCAEEDKSNELLETRNTGLERHFLRRSGCAFGSLHDGQRAPSLQLFRWCFVRKPLVYYLYVVFLF